MPRSRPAIVTEPYESLVADSLRAFARDPGYATDMANAAVRIATKQAQWSCRTDLRASAAAATAACSQLPEFTCTARGVCGTGGCRFATDDLIQLDVESRPGKGTRPQPHVDGPTFDVESCVRPLVALRALPRGAA